ncbi:MAG: PaaI family thioesterase [Hyphomonadaceae bacterium]|nr:PaaI family thioesterase [Hyphomonadaceae bacterium]
MTEVPDLNRLLARSPFASYLAIQAAVDDAGVLATLPARDSLVGNVLLPALHGGAIAAFLEITCLLQLAYETGTTVPARTLDFSVEYLRPGRPEATFARARIRRLGRRVATVHAEAWQRDVNAPVCLVQCHLRLPADVAGAATVTGAATG